MPLLHFKSDALPGGVSAGEARVREKVFLEHYASLKDRALQFTHGQKERAEDLVHDTFVQFQVKQVDVEAIEDVKAYLHGMLRNLYLLQVRRATRHPVHQLSLLDHDSADIGLRAQSPADQFQAADLLVRACRFVCHRKESSIPASILTLRFFHGYYTDEICQLTGTQRRQVNKWLSRGREETKAFLANPQPLPEDKKQANPAPPSSPRSFLIYLRRLIFDSCTAPCEVLAPDAAVSDVQALAHLVSCPTCLERRSRQLGLPSVNERMMDDISNGNDGPAPESTDKLRRSSSSLASRGKTKTSQRIRRAYHDRLREVFEHHPSELSIAFDGETHATLLLNGPLNTLNLSLEQKQCPDSIAILSEQEVCLLVLDRKEIECAERKVYSVSLSDGRDLQVEVFPDYRGPSIHIAYRDPDLSPSRLLVQERNERDERLSLRSGDEAHSRIVSFVLHWWRKLVQRLGNIPVPSMNPTLATSMVLAVAATVLLVLGLQQQQRKAAAVAMLTRAAAADPVLQTSGQPGVIYQSIKIRTREGSVERTIYRDAQRKRRSKPSPLGANQALARKLAGAGVNWDAPLSPAGYKDWHDRQPSESDTITRAGSNLIVLTTSVSGDPDVASESLTLRESDLHAVSRSVNFRSSGTVEIAELEYGELPWGPETDGFFEPESSGFPKSVHPSVLPHLPRVLSESQFDEAELEARLALHAVGADTNERVDIARGTNSVNVRGVVATDARKREIESQLRLIPNVIAAIYTFDELEKGSKSSQDVTSLALSSVTETPSPLEVYLQGKGASLEEIRQTGLKLSNASVVITREAKALSELHTRYPVSDELTATARDALRALVADHKTKLLAAIAVQQQVLEGAGFTPSPSSATDANADLSALSQRVNARCIELLSGAAEPSRPASQIVPELFSAATELHLAAARIPDTLSSAQAAATSTTKTRP